MTDEPVCGLCGLPPYTLNGRAFFGAEVGDIPLHHTDERTWQIGCNDDDDGGCTPIFTTCYRAWTIYGHRPYGWTEEEAS